MLLVLSIFYYSYCREVVSSIVKYFKRVRYSYLTLGERAAKVGRKRARSKVNGKVNGKVQYQG